MQSEVLKTDHSPVPKAANTNAAERDGADGLARLGVPGHGEAALQSLAGRDRTATQSTARCATASRALAMALEERGGSAGHRLVSSTRRASIAPHGQHWVWQQSPCGGPWSRLEAPVLRCRPHGAGELAANAGVRDPGRNGRALPRSLNLFLEDSSAIVELL